MEYQKKNRLNITIDITPYNVDLAYISEKIIARICRLLDKYEMEYEIHCKEL